MKQLSGSWIYIGLFYRWIGFLLSLKYCFTGCLYLAEQLMLEKRKWMRKKTEEQLFSELL